MSALIGSGIVNGFIDQRTASGQRISSIDVIYSYVQGTPMSTGISVTFVNGSSLNIGYDANKGEIHSACNTSTGILVRWSHTWNRGGFLNVGSHLTGHYLEFSDGAVSRFGNTVPGNVNTNILVNRILCRGRITLDWFQLEGIVRDNNLPINPIQPQPLPPINPDMNPVTPVTPDNTPKPPPTGGCSCDHIQDMLNKLEVTISIDDFDKNIKPAMIRILEEDRRQLKAEVKSTIQLELRGFRPPANDKKPGEQEAIIAELHRIINRQDDLFEKQIEDTKAILDEIARGGNTSDIDTQLNQLATQLTEARDSLRKDINNIKPADTSGIERKIDELSTKLNNTANKADLSNLAQKSDLNTLAKSTELQPLAKSSELQNLAKTSDLSNLATKQDLSGMIKPADLQNLAKISDLQNLAKSSEIQPLAKSTELVPLAKSSELAELAKTTDITPLAKSAELIPLAKSSELSELVKQSDIQSLAKSSEIANLPQKADLNNLATKTDINDVAKQQTLTEIKATLVEIKRKTDNI